MRETISTFINFNIFVETKNFKSYGEFMFEG